MRKASSVAKPKGRAGAQEFRAYTIEGRHGFNPVFTFRTTQRGYRSFLAEKGLHQRIEAFMVAHPNSRLPTRALTKEYGAARGAVHVIAKQVQRAHGLPARKRGGLNGPFLPKFLDLELERIYLRSPKNANVKVYDLVRDFAIANGGIVPSFATVMQHIKAFESKHKKRLKIEFGLNSAEQGSLDALISRLQNDPEIVRKKIALRRLHKKMGGDFTD